VFLALKVPMSIAHFAYQPASAGVEAAGFRALLELARRGNTWIKISGANRVAATDCRLRRREADGAGLIGVAPSASCGDRTGRTEQYVANPTTGTWSTLRRLVSDDACAARSWSRRPPRSTVCSRDVPKERLGEKHAFHSTYLADRVGRAAIAPREFEAGSFASITLTYTAGYFGIDDTGSLKIVNRFASDAGSRSSMTEGWNYVTAEASNGAVLELRYEQKGQYPPWTRPFSSACSAASCAKVTPSPCAGRYPGQFARTAHADVHEPTFEFRSWWMRLRLQLCGVAGAAGRFDRRRTACTLQGYPADRALRGPELLARLQGRGQVGNPSSLVEGTFTLRANMPVAGLPGSVEARRARSRTASADCR